MGEPALHCLFPQHLNQETTDEPTCPSASTRASTAAMTTGSRQKTRIVPHHFTQQYGREQTPQTEEMRRENRFRSTEPTTDTSRSGDEIKPGSLGRRLCVCVYARPRAIRRRRRLLYSGLSRLAGPFDKKGRGLWMHWGSGMHFGGYLKDMDAKSQGAGVTTAEARALEGEHMPTGDLLMAIISH